MAHSTTLFCWLLLGLTAGSSRAATVLRAAPRVGTTHGTVVGSIMQAIPTGRTFYAFRRIPYAKPPIGDLRFKAPQDITPWQGELQATQDAPLCIQKDILQYANPKVIGQEDCLYLNVYTPTLDAKQASPTALLPVMVYIHGGGFYSGTSSSDVHGPEYLLTRDVVLVTFNYRLGVMGFLSTGDSHVPGNAGLKDQVAVLRWVQANAAAFGGDPQLVTIFGQSAGGSSVHYHLLSSLSSGLFHRAIAQSGSALNVWSWGSTLGPLIAHAQASFVNCTRNSTEEMVKCLQEVGAEQLVDTSSYFHMWSIDPTVVFAPVIEPTTNSLTEEERFITVSPFTLIKEGRVQPVPFMLGVVPSEGVVRAGAILNDAELLKDFNTKRDMLGPFLLGVNQSLDLGAGTAEQEKAIWNEIDNYFFKHESVDQQNEADFVNMYSDRVIVQGTFHTAHAHKSLDVAPVFLYMFTHQGANSFTPIMSHANWTHGVGHCDDLIYLFNSPALFPPFPQGHPDNDVRDLMVRVWTDFARFGSPAPARLKAGLKEWKPLSPCEPLHFANISSELNPGETEFFNERMQFWRSLPLNENLQVQISSSGKSLNCTDSPFY